MKLRMQINSNAEKFSADIFEDAGKILVRKMETNGEGNFARAEIFEFETLEKLNNWIKNQEWINNKKIKFVSEFKGVR